MPAGRPSARTLLTATGPGPNLLARIRRTGETDGRNPPAPGSGPGFGPGPGPGPGPGAGEGSVDLAVHLLGPFQLLRHGHPLDTRNGAKSFRVLKYLLAHRQQPIMKDVLIDLFWPDCDFESVGRNLHQAIYTLRKLLRDGGPDRPYVVFENDAYLLDPTLSIWCDADEMEAGATAGRSAEQAGDVLAAAADLRAGDGLLRRGVPGRFTVRGVGADRAGAAAAAVRGGSEPAGELRLGMGDVEAAAAVSRQLLRHETCDEEAHRRLIRCYGAAGHRTMVVRQYRAYVECAERIYGVGPSPETTRLYESLIAD